MSEKMQFDVLFDAEKIKCPNTGLYTFNKHLSRALYDESLCRGYSFGAYCAHNVVSHLLSVPYKSSFYLFRYYLPLNGGTRVWHAPYQLGKFFPVTGQKVVLTIHDLNFLYEKNNIRRKLGLYRLQRNIDRADHLVAISNFTKEDVMRHLNVGDRPFDVIYNGYTPHELPTMKIEPLSAAKFLFSMATILPKKNFHVLPCLLVDNDYELIIAGNMSTYVDDIMAEAREFGVEHRVKVVGPVTEEQKAWYLRNCDAFLFPSIAEGFGLPVIEAMYHGKPIFLSQHTCLPEIGGELCYYFNYDFDRAAMQQEFRRGMEDFDSTRSEALVARAKTFTWQRAAKQYWDIYQKLIHKAKKDR